MTEAWGWEDRVARWTPWLICAYFALHVLIRVTAPGGLGLDEAEQMVAVQSLEWGYGPQPPLYTWLQWLVFQVTGEGKLGLSLLKNGLLAATFLTIWATARWLTGSDRIAAVAALSLMLLPPVAWEAQRALTHSVLAIALAALLVTTVICTRRAGRPMDYVVVGVVLGAGVIAKGNVAFLAGGLMAALLMERAQWRWGWLVSLAVAALVIAGPALWALENAGLATRTSDKFGVGEGGPLAGMLALAEACIAFAALLIVAHGAVFWWRKPAGAAAPEDNAFLGRSLLIGLGLVAIAVLVSGATDVKARWLQPLLIALPLWLTLRFAPRVAGGLRLFFPVVALLAVAVLIAVPLNLRRGGNNPSYHSAPIAAVMEALPEGGLILAGDDWLGGNMRLVRPGLAVLVPEMPAMVVAGTPSRAVWWTRDDKAVDPPEELAALVTERTGRNLAALPRQTAAQAYASPHGDRTFRLHWAALD